MTIPNQKEHRNKKFKSEWLLKTSASDCANEASKILNIKNKNILEIWCGVGYDSSFFEEKGGNITAIDFSNYVIQQNKIIFKKSNINFIELDTKNIWNYKFNKTFDLVFARLSLHYFNTTTTKKIIQNIYKLMNNSWFLYFSVKSTNDQKYLAGEEIEKNIFINKWHLIHLFNKKELENLLKQFKIIKLQEEKWSFCFRKIICQKI